MGYDETKELTSTNAKCDNCGGNLVFDPVSQNLKCPNCGSEFPFEKTKTQVKHPIEESRNTVQEHDQWAKEAKGVKCQTCGAEIILSGLEMTSCCPYCGSDYVVEKELLAGLKPDVVLPFYFNEKEAARRFAIGIKKKFFAPRALKKELPANKIHGIYIPAFTFDADTRSSYKGVLIKRYTKRDSKGNTRTEIKRIPISGSLDMKHRDYVVESSSQIVEKDIEALLPFDMNASFAFSNNFLRGYSVEHYEDALNKCYTSAKKDMDAKIKNKILSQYDYSTVESFNVDTNYSNELYSYRLLPLYCFEYEYNKKHYRTLMNGQSGKVGTGYPISAVKKALCIIGLVIATIAIIALLIYLYIL